jgi:hypothetical protein
VFFAVLFRLLKAGFEVLLFFLAHAVEARNSSFVRLFIELKVAVDHSGREVMFARIGFFILFEGFLLLKRRDWGFGEEPVMILFFSFHYKVVPILRRNRSSRRGFNVVFVAGSVYQLRGSCARHRSSCQRRGLLRLPILDDAHKGSRDFRKGDFVDPSAKIHMHRVEAYRNDFGIFRESPEDIQKHLVAPFRRNLFADDSVHPSPAALHHTKDVLPLRVVPCYANDA